MFTNIIIFLVQMYCTFLTSYDMLINISKVATFWQKNSTCAIFWHNLTLILHRENNY